MKRLGAYARAHWKELLALGLAAIPAAFLLFHKGTQQAASSALSYPAALLGGGGSSAGTDSSGSTSSTSGTTPPATTPPATTPPASTPPAPRAGPKPSAALIAWRKAKHYGAAAIMAPPTTKTVLPAPAKPPKAVAPPVQYSVAGANATKVAVPPKGVPSAALQAWRRKKGYGAAAIMAPPTK